MRGKIPKTELLVTFEVVARHESYTRALMNPLMIFIKIIKLR